MTVALLFLSAMMAVVVWWLIRQSLNTTPWVAQGVDEAPAHDPRGTIAIPREKLALGVFLCVATSLFALLTSAYFMRMANADWSAPQLPRLLWLNTAVLVASSIAVQWTRNSARRFDSSRVRSGLLGGGLLTIAFLVGQIAVWRILAASGAYAAANPANAFFYLFTAVHALHLLGGLWVWGRTTAAAWGDIDIPRMRLRIELCAVYWHFLLLVWLVLFVLLLLN